ncbi:GerAB/ArcD/ProY family transporter [Paenibacillus sp. CF384]|uniref:GerAB/ArcD/ProY family transporter n=1 Tax=Paenibacillus sp. CF384 TaxID=1884382 RepID=UPI00089A75DA|nr:GerAB/ArcD/ProY family transporter [Paenibacillus sp. CF384]SDW06687.1 spore germination protein (amino acid permease) [Paenibacillus sp. CF384]
MTAMEQARLTVSPYLVFPLVHSMQFGSEYLDMSIKPIQFAGNDTWISVLICGLFFHIIIWMIYGILNGNKTDLLQIHQRFFGKFVGRGLNMIFIVYFLLHASLLIRLFIEIVQVWLFPELATWLLALVLLLLVYYIVSGGFRVIVGICFLSLLRHLLILAMLFTAGYFHFNNLSPVMDHSLNELLLATKELTFPYVGVEMLFFVYTFIKTPEKSHKWAQLANLITTLSYLVVVLFSLLLFKFEQLSNQLWPQLTKYKFVKFPFIERFEFVGASAQIFWVIPIICLCLWASSRAVKVMFSVKQRTVLPICLVVVFAAVSMIAGRNQVEALQALLAQIGFYMIFAYIPFMYLVDMVRVKVKGTI